MRFDGRVASGTERVDLETARETISYIRDDLATVDGLEAAAAALSRAIGIIDEHRRNVQPRQRIAIAPRFLRSPFRR
jgi:hypothetical protein